MKPKPLRRTLLLAPLLACASTAPTADSGGPSVERDGAAPPADRAADRAPVPPPDAGVDVAADAEPDAAADLAAGPPADGAPPADAAGPLALTSTGFLMTNGELIFPASACYPMDRSPPFAWTGAPPGTRSFALTFVDESNGATKWVVWDIPPEVTMLPENLSKTVHPVEVPRASQRGSLGRTGYSGPGVAGPPLHVYQFVLWALDVDQLPGTEGLSTVELRTQVLPAHALARSKPLVAKGQLGGSR